MKAPVDRKHVTQMCVYGIYKYMHTDMYSIMYTHTRIPTTTYTLIYMYIYKSVIYIYIYIYIYIHVCFMQPTRAVHLRVDSFSLWLWNVGP